MKQVSGVKRNMTHTGEFYIMDTESFDEKDKGETRGTNTSVIALENCINILYQINNRTRDELYVPYD